MSVLPVARSSGCSFAGSGEKIHFEAIKPYINECEKVAPDSQICWCDQRSFRDENADGASPGGRISPFGYFVIGTTIGGNAIVVSDGEPRVCFADHTWYKESGIGYQDLAGDRQWHYVDTSLENVRLSLFSLAPDRNSFLQRLASGTVDGVLDEVD